MKHPSSFELLRLIEGAKRRVIKTDNLLKSWERSLRGSVFVTPQR
jgi:hypothetical protein